ncbi:hybrid sensor histidine kinase/response regulator transcription factor [Prolixibacter denitrificans]|uniref:histidine kinase n=1 Tax=Prolixibacter denitrificans TaxID=1541063 RepID=A0A2P8C662_9BACT|nr:two-component regulator propeller domain-containing protein [Prolixibacter denitrificans]PSK80437.1 two component regulator with propeller domain [Prolixibacter denitrificans]GET23023.1 hybrid sensor histidine kinase/response regulator [Prolixibacter denitrificans]
MRSKLFILIVAIFHFGVCISNAQTKRLFDHNEGLSNSLINQVFQDHMGFIWVATEDGLNRFDGIKYTSYSHHDNQPQSLKSNFVTSLAEDKDGNLWVGLINGLQIYDYATETFREIKLFTDSTNIHPYISSIICASNGDIWMTTSGYGVFRIKRDTEIPVQLTGLNERLNSHFLRTIFEDSDGTVWLGSDDEGLNSYNPKTDEVLSFRQSAPRGYALTSNDISSICQDNHGGIYVGSLNGGLVRINKNTRQIERIPSAGTTQSNLPVKSLYFDSQHQLWVGTDGFGLKLLNRKTNQLESHSPSSSSFDFSKSKIHSIIEDTEGNLWVGIFQKGLFLFPDTPEMFRHFGYEAFGKNSIGSSSITSIDGKGDILWIGTDGDGIYRLNLANEKVKHLTLRDPKGVTRGNNILVLHNGPDQYLWIGTYSNGLIRYDKENKSIKIYKNDPKNGHSLANDKITTIKEDSNGELLLGTLGGGICRFNPKTQLFYKGLNIPDSLNDQIQKWVNDIFIDKDRRYWVGTYGGLYVVDPKAGVVTRFSEADKTLVNNTVYCIQSDSKGTIWVGTYDGLEKIDPQTFQTKVYRMENGLGSNVICAIQEDEHHKLWISTHKGLSRFDPEKELFTNYYASDGIQSNEFSRNASFKTSRQELFFGGINGITEVKKNYPNFKQKIRDVILTDFSLFNQPVQIGQQSGKHIILNKSIVLADTVRLRERDNVFSIGFTSLELANQSRISYQYKMVGFDENWSITNSMNRRATYTNLPHGTYTFYVRAVDKAQISNPRKLTIIIFPPWYKTAWAKALWVLLIFGLFYGIILFYREKLMRRHAEQINEMKMQFFINISHEIKTPLALIIDPLEKLLNQKSDEKTSRLYKVMYQNASRIFRLVNQLMDVRKIDKGLLLVKFQQTNLYNFTREISHSYDLLAISKNISFEIETTDPDIQVWIDPLNFEKVILNLLSNAFKFTPEGGSIKIHIEKVPTEKQARTERVRITVSDSGTGIKERDLERIFSRFYQVDSKEARYMGGTGIGLHLSRSLVQLHNGELIAKNRTDGPGSKFIITLPLGNEHLPKEDLVTEENLLPTPIQRITPQVSPRIIEESHPKHQKPKTSYKVMIIDDEDEIRNYLVDELSGTYNVVEYKNGKEAFESLMDENPDLILSDIMMPEMDGIAFCKKVKGNIHTSHIPVVLLTALSKEENRVEGIETGADMYLVKPFNSELLRKTIAGILENRRRIYEKFKDTEEQHGLVDTALKSHDEILMQKVMTIVKDNISEKNLNVEMLAEGVGISRVHMHRKLKELTNHSARDFIRNIRMKQAAYLLANKKLNVSEVAYAVGYSNLSHFSNTFKSHYGVSPKEYSEKQHKSMEEEDKEQ